LPSAPEPPVPVSPSMALRALVEKSAEKRVPVGEISAHRAVPITSGHPSSPSTKPPLLGVHTSGWANVAADALREVSATRHSRAVESGPQPVVGKSSQQRMADFVAEAAASPSVQQQPTVAANANAATVAVSASGSVFVAATVAMPSPVSVGTQTVTMSTAAAASMAAASMQQATVARPLDSLQELFRRSAEVASSATGGVHSTPTSHAAPGIADEHAPGQTSSPVAQTSAPLPNSTSVSLPSPTSAPEPATTASIQHPLAADSPTVAWNAPASAPANDVRARLATLAQKLADHRASSSSYPAVSGDISAAELASRPDLVPAPGDGPAISTGSRPVPTDVVALHEMPRSSAVQDPSQQWTTMEEEPPVAPVRPPTAPAPTSPGQSDDEEPTE
jgi:hypothetical protein